MAHNIRNGVLHRRDKDHTLASIFAFAKTQILLGSARSRPHILFRGGLIFLGNQVWLMNISNFVPQGSVPVEEHLIFLGLLMYIS
jgi:hypothetical protein